MSHSVFAFSFRAGAVYIILLFSSSATDGFYSASTLLAMHSAVIATADLSVCPSVMFRCFVWRNEDTIVRSSVSGSTMGEVKFR